jgi:dynein heavy chain
MHMNVGLRVRANIHVLRVFIRRHLCKFALSWCLVRLFVIQVPSDSIVNSAMTRVFDKYYSKAKAPPLVTKMARMLPEATIALCKSLKQSLTSNDSKAHYTFNLHDTMCTLKSLLHCSPSQLATPEDVMRLWRHECERVFSDKLVSVNHQAVVLESIQHILQHKSFDEINRDLCLVEENDRFGSFFRTDALGAAILGYGVLPDMDTLFDQLEAMQTKKKIICPLYDDAIEQIIRMARVLSMPRGSVILVGSIGSGRASLARMAAAVSESSCFCPDDDILQGKGTYMDSIGQAYRIAGLEARSVTVVMCADNLLDAGLLDKLNNFLVTGVLPGAIQKKEFDVIADEMRLMLKDGASSLQSDRQILSTFERRAWQNMHLVVCCRPKRSGSKDVETRGNRVEDLMTRFPALLSACQTIWLQQWAGETLNDVAAVYFQDFAVESMPIEIPQLCEYMAEVHKLIEMKVIEYNQSTNRHIYVTPRSYLDFLLTFKVIYESQSKSLEDRTQRIQTALKKLRDAGYQVSETKAELIRREEALQEANRHTDDLLQRISIVTMKAERKKAEVQAYNKKLSERGHDIQQERATFELDFESAKPFLVEAKNAFESVSKEEIVHLGSQKTQPAIVKLVIDAVLLVIRHAIRPIEMQARDSFAFFAELVNLPDGYDRLLEVKEDALNAETAELLAPYLKHKDFNIEKISTVSTPAAGLAKWVQAMVRFFDATNPIIPKMRAVDEQEMDLEEEYHGLEEMNEEYEVCLHELEMMHVEFEKAMADKQTRKSEADYTRTKLSASTLLLTGMQEERARWIQDTEEGQAEADPLPGDAGIAAAMMIYLGPFNLNERAELLQALSGTCQELEIQFSQELHVPKFFTTQNEISAWCVQGLPTDEFSIQNGMLALYCRRCPLLIDPQEQCVRWIQKREDPRVISDFINPEVFAKTVANAIVSGRVLIYEGIERGISVEVETLFDQMFAISEQDKMGHASTNTASNASEKRLFWRGTKLEWHTDFRIYLASVLPDPHFDAELSGRTTLINFSLTLRGLEDQLLNIIVQTANSDLEITRLELQSQISSKRQEMDDLDKKILTELSESEGNLLDNDLLMERLSEIKEQLTKADESLLQAEESEGDVLKSFESYRPVALRGSLLFFALADMMKLDRMYTISLSMFFTDLKRTLTMKDDSFSDRAAAVYSDDERMQLIADKITAAMLKNCACCYTRQHQIVFELAVALRLELTEEQWNNPDYVHCLSKCGSGLEISLVQRKPFQWIPDPAWLNLVCLVEKMPFFRSIMDSMAKPSRESQWRVWYEQSMPESEPVPEHENLAPLFRLLLVRALREDRMIAATRDYFQSVLGDSVSGQTEFNIEAVWKKSTPQRPIILLSPNRDDPFDAIVAFAKQTLGTTSMCSTLSLGEGSLKSEDCQNSQLHAAVKSAVSKGGWLVLQNVHLYPAEELERHLISFSDLFAMHEAKAQELRSGDRAKLPRADGITSESMGTSQGSLIPRGKTSQNIYADVRREGFRLWITAPTWEGCPMTLILRSVRAYYEAPTGVRETMLHLYENQVKEQHDRGQWDKLWARQLYCLSVCYTVMKERRSYGTAAWSCPVDLDLRDWTKCLTHLKNYFFDALLDDEIPSAQSQMLDATRSMLRDVLLGARLVDENDFRILKVLLDRVYTENLFGQDTYELLPGCRMPEEHSHASFMEAISELPSEDPAALLCLSSNADLLHRAQGCHQMIGGIAALAPPHTESPDDAEMEEVVTEIATNMLAKIPSPWVSGWVGEKVVGCGNVESLYC